MADVREYINERTSYIKYVEFGDWRTVTISRNALPRGVGVGMKNNSYM